MKLVPGTELVIASHNKGKVAEISELVAPRGLIVRGAGELGLAEPEETGTSFEANAVLKANVASAACGLWALADDSGLCVTALDGAPGIYSARWADHKDFYGAMARIERELKAVDAKDYSAKFVCALALSAPDGETETYVGEVQGTLCFPPRGTNGFGYDPIFIADGMDKTFGEIDPAHKHAISHRARAFSLFAERALG